MHPCQCVDRKDTCITHIHTTYIYAHMHDTNINTHTYKHICITHKHTNNI